MHTYTHVCMYIFNGSLPQFSKSKTWFNGYSNKEMALSKRWNIGR